jgi:hypothetical protein
MTQAIGHQTFDTIRRGRNGAQMYQWKCQCGATSGAFRRATTRELDAQRHRIANGLPW